MAMEQKMSDTAFRICLWEVMGLPPRDLYAQLAEEGAELTQAALKCIRAQGFSQNPTSLSCEDAVKNLWEELNDVLLVAYGLCHGPCRQILHQRLEQAGKMGQANRRQEKRRMKNDE